MARPISSVVLHILITWCGYTDDDFDAFDAVAHETMSVDVLVTIAGQVCIIVASM